MKYSERNIYVFVYSCNAASQSMLNSLSLLNIMSNSKIGVIFVFPGMFMSQPSNRDQLDFLVNLTAFNINISPSFDKLLFCYIDSLDLIDANIPKNQKLVIQNLIVEFVLSQESNFLLLKQKAKAHLKQFCKIFQKNGNNFKTALSTFTKELNLPKNSISNYL